MRSLDDEYPTLAGARRELRADLLERRAVEKCAERAADMGLVADAEMFARALAGLPRTRELLGRTALPAPVVAVVGKPGDTHLAVDGKRFARLWRVGEEGVVVERLVGFADIPDVLIAAALASVVVDGTTSPEETVPVGIAFLDSDRLFWSRGSDDWHVDARAHADAIISAARFFPDDDTRALLVRAVEVDAGDKTAYAWLKELVSADMRERRHRAALRALQVMHRVSPRDPDVLEMIAASFEAAGSSDRAKLLSEQARELRRVSSSR